MSTTPNATDSDESNFSITHNATSFEDDVELDNEDDDDDDEEEDDDDDEEDETYDETSTTAHTNSAANATGTGTGSTNATGTTGNNAADTSSASLEADAPPYLKVNFDWRKDRREIGGEAVWTLSSAKTGNGVDQLRDNDMRTFWQSDGTQPHHVNIQFLRKKSVAAVSFFLEHKLDESYTPKVDTTTTCTCTCHIRHHRRTCRISLRLSIVVFVAYTENFDPGWRYLP